jgi:cysteine-rich repeat protein
VLNALSGVMTETIGGRAGAFARNRVVRALHISLQPLVSIMPSFRFSNSLLGASLVCLLVGATGCGLEQQDDDQGDLELSIQPTSIDGTFAYRGRVVGFHSESSDGGARALIQLDVDGLPLDIAIDFEEETLMEDAHDSVFGLEHRGLLLALRDAVAEHYPMVLDTLHGKALVKTADRYAEVPLDLPLAPRHITLVPEVDAVVSGCGDDGVTCLSGTSGSSYAIFFAAGICDARSTAYGDSQCRGRCGMGCNWFDNDYTWDCLDHDVCLDYSNQCDEEFNEAADDWVATLAPLCFGGSSRPKPPAVPKCGDGVTNPGEQCDDGNQNNGDGCEANCTVTQPRCGDGKVDSGEQCDDGGTTAGDGCSATCTTETARLVINEVDYDLPGTDNAEFVEILNDSPLAVDLVGKALVAINGSTSTEVSRTALEGTLAGGGYLVVCPRGSASGTCVSSLAIPAGTLVVNFAAATNNLQNGSPDGVALVDLGAGTVLDALSYEGSITAAAITGLGTFSLVEGSPLTVADAGTFANALARTPNGSDSNNAATDWASRAPTPGAPNP